MKFGDWYKYIRTENTRADLLSTDCLLVKI